MGMVDELISAGHKSRMQYPSLLFHPYIGRGMLEHVRIGEGGGRESFWVAWPARRKQAGAQPSHSPVAIATLSS